MRCAIKFCYCFDKTAKLWKKLKTNALISLQFLDYYGDFKKGHLSVQLVPKPGWLESIMNDWNVNVVWTI